MNIEDQLIAAFNGEPPTITAEQWSKLLEKRQELGRMLTDSEAREVVTCTQ